MNFAKRNLLSAFLCPLFAACLETPGAPDTSTGIDSVSVCLSKSEGTGSSCADTLSTSPADSFALKAQIFPDSLEGELSFRWVRASETLARGALFSTDTSRVPDSLIVSDKSSNRMSIPVFLVFDTAPEMEPETVPADGDTLVGDRTTAFRFAYEATDADADDTLFYEILLDSTLFQAGTLTSFVQSGLDTGSHTMRVFVEDLYGFRDSTDLVTFHVTGTDDE